MPRARCGCRCGKRPKDSKRTHRDEQQHSNPQTGHGSHAFLDSRCRVADSRISIDGRGRKPSGGPVSPIGWRSAANNRQARYRHPWSRSLTREVYSPLASHHARISANRRSASEPKTASLVSFARLVAGLVMPARNRACCLGAPSASGWLSRSAASASTLTLVSIGGFGSSSGRTRCSGGG